MNVKNREKCDLCGIDQSFFKILYNLDNFRIMKCKKCGLVFRDIILSPQETNQLYSSDYFTKEQKDFFFGNNDFRISDFTNRIIEIEKIYTKKGRLLDVGCAIAAGAAGPSGGHRSPARRGASARSRAVLAAGAAALRSRDRPGVLRS